MLAQLKVLLQNPGWQKTDYYCLMVHHTDVNIVAAIATLLLLLPLPLPLLYYCYSYSLLPLALAL